MPSHRFYSLAYLSIFFCASLTPTHALTIADSSSSSQQPPAARQEIVLPINTKIVVTSDKDLYSSTVIEGELLIFQVAEEIKVGGQVVVRKGAPVQARVAAAQLAASFGRSGRLALEIEETATVDGQKLKLRGAISQRGRGKSSKTLALSVLFGPLGGREVEGENAKIKAGTKITAYADEDKKVSIP